MSNMTSSVQAFAELAADHGKFIGMILNGLLTKSPSEWLADAQGTPEIVSKWLSDTWQRNPFHLVIESLLLLYLVYVWTLYNAKGSRRASKPAMTREEEEELIDDWEPEPIVPPASRGTIAAGLDAVVVEEQLTDGVHVRVRGHTTPVINMMSCDFLNFSTDAATRATAEKALDKFTCGSCGPRGFYGTTEAHLELENAIAEFMSVPESITYSDSISTAASVIPAFAKRSDILIVDDGVNHSVQTGVSLSRGTVLPFRHNDMLDLERVLAGLPRGPKTKDQRRFIVVEGLYANHGDVCPLPDVLKLADRYLVRVILDDSLGFGALGKHGRGTTEFYSIEPRAVHILIGSLATTLGSVGGFCIGSREVVDHQRLSGAGYCFSASLPPFLCVAATTALQRMAGSSDLLERLRGNAMHMRARLDESRGRFKVVSTCAVSPVIHLRLSWHSDIQTNDPERLLAVQREAAESGTPFGISGGASDEDKIGGARISPHDGDDEHDAAGVRNAGTPFSSALLRTPLRPRPARRRFQTAQDDDLDRVVAGALRRGVLLARTRFLVTDRYAPAQALCVHVTSALSREQINHAVAVIEDAVEEAFEAHTAVGGRSISSPARRPVAAPSASSSRAAAAEPAASSARKRRTG